MSLVLDSSMCLAWCFEDERTPEVLAVREQVIEAGATVPTLWRYEMANALLMAQRRKRIDEERRTVLLRMLEDFSIEEDQAPEGDPWGAAVRLADLHRLTVYDAAYLELAQRRRLPLATLDEALRIAAGKAAVKLLP
jgi:predicted nucleic acid-binding protein